MEITLFVTLVSGPKRDSAPPQNEYSMLQIKHEKSIINPLCDPSPTHKSYYLRTHIGTATYNGEYKGYDTGLIVTADEGCGYT